VTELLFVGLAVGGACTFVWSMIMQAEAQLHPQVARSGDRTPRLRVPRRKARTSGAAELGPPAAWLQDATQLTLPLSGLAPVRHEDSADWSDRPSRLVSALELLVLIMVVGGVVAAATLGTARMVARIVAAHFAG
jgi:hypothetical protein